MFKQLGSRRALGASFLFGSFVLITAANSPAIFAQSTRQAKASQPAQSAAAIEAIKASFGSSLEPVSGFNPYYLTGDFNGDGAQDLVMVVRIKGRSSDLPADVKVYNPFERPKAIFPDDPAATPTLAFAVIHGAKTGWKTPPAAERFLLFGQTPILILQYQRATSGRPDEGKSLMELLKKTSRDWKHLGWSATLAKGDSILMPTEATDSILFWTGKNYRWIEAMGGE